MRLIIYIYIIITLYGPKFEQFRCSDVSVLLGRISASSGLRIRRLLERFRKKNQTEPGETSAKTNLCIFISGYSFQNIHQL